MFDVSVILCPRCMCPPTRCGRGDARRPNSCRTSRLRKVTPQAENNSLLSYYILHCFICRPLDSTVPTDAGIEPRTVAIGALAVRRSNH